MRRYVRSRPGRTKLGYWLRVDGNSEARHYGTLSSTARRVSLLRRTLENFGDAMPSTKNRN